MDRTPTGHRIPLLGLHQRTSVTTGLEFGSVYTGSLFIGKAFGRRLLLLQFKPPTDKRLRTGSTWRRTVYMPALTLRRNHTPSLGRRIAHLQKKHGQLRYTGLTIQLRSSPHALKRPSSNPTPLERRHSFWMAAILVNSTGHICAHLSRSNLPTPAPVRAIPEGRWQVTIVQYALNARPS